MKLNEVHTTGRNILGANNSTLSRELIRALLEGLDPSGPKSSASSRSFGIAPTLTGLHAQRPSTFGINHNDAQTPTYGDSTDASCHHVKVETHIDRELAAVLLIME